MKKKISILGSTGSIGVNALNVIKNISQEYEIVHLTGNTNADLMIEQCREFHPKSIVMINEDSSEKVQRWVALQVIKSFFGMPVIPGK